VKDLDKLKLTLKNLSDKGQSVITLDVNYLLNILENISKQSPTSRRPNIDWVDGGNFADD